MARLRLNVMDVWLVGKTILSNLGPVWARLLLKVGLLLRYLPVSQNPDKGPPQLWLAASDGLEA